MAGRIPAVAGAKSGGGPRQPVPFRSLRPGGSSAGCDCIAAGDFTTVEWTVKNYTFTGRSIESYTLHARVDTSHCPDTCLCKEKQEAS